MSTFTGLTPEEIQTLGTLRYQAESSPSPDPAMIAVLTRLIEDGPHSEPVLAGRDRLLVTLQQELEHFIDGRAAQHRLTYAEIMWLLGRAIEQSARQQRCLDWRLGNVARRVRALLDASPRWMDGLPPGVALAIATLLGELPG